MEKIYGITNKSGDLSEAYVLLFYARAALSNRGDRAECKLVEIEIASIKPVVEATPIKRGRGRK